MGLWSAPKYAGLPAEREAELWKLVESLQREKDVLRSECQMWRERFLSLAGIGDQTLPAQHIPEKDPEAKTEGPGVLGRHISLMGLRHKYEQKSREEAARVKRESA